MRRFLAPSSGLDKFFAAQFSAGYISMSGFDLRRAVDGQSYFDLAAISHPIHFEMDATGRLLKPAP